MYRIWIVVWRDRIDPQIGAIIPDELLFYHGRTHAELVAADDYAATICAEAPSLKQARQAALELVPNAQMLLSLGITTPLTR